MKKRYYILNLAFITLLCSHAYSQGGPVLTPTSTCPPGNATNKAHFSVKVFLTMDPWENDRVESGTDNIPLAEIRAVTNSSVCDQLSALIDSNARFQNIANNTSKEKKYYRTDHFYYIFWRHSTTKLGPRTSFIVVSEDFQSFWEYFV